MNNKALKLALTLFVAAITGCGGGSSGTGTFSSGLDQDRILSSLSPSDIKQFCDREEQFYETFKNPGTVCPYVALVVSLDPTQISQSPDQRVMDCQNVQDSCISQFPTLSTQLPPLTCSLNADRPISSCNVSVKLVEECANDLFTSIEDIFQSVSCEDARVRTDANDLTSAFEFPINIPSGACEELKRICPEDFA